MLKLATGLNHAIQHDQLILCYQPQFNLVSGELVGVEALVRWRHPARGLMLPDEFIPLAEKTGLIVTLGEWVLRRACQQYQEWTQRGLSLPRIAVNIASRQLEEENVVQMVMGVLAETGMPPERLEIELTETGRSLSPDALQKLIYLRSQGIEIALDDFGVGCSSLWAIKFVPLTRIKLAQLYIEGIGNNLTDESIVRMVIDLAHSLGLRVIAEGVDTLEKKQFLQTHRCHEVQGFYFSMPLTGDEVFTLFFGK